MPEMAGLDEGGRVPSTNQLAAFNQINPATAAKGINVLADDGLLEKRRGIGMFVATGGHGSGCWPGAGRNSRSGTSGRCSPRRPASVSIPAS